MVRDTELVIVHVLIEAVRGDASTRGGSDDDGVISQSKVNVRPASSEALSHRAALLVEAVQGISSTPSDSDDVDATSVSQCDVRPASSEVALFDRAALLVEAVHDIASFSASSRPVSASSVSARAPRASHEVSTGSMEACAVVRCVHSVCVSYLEITRGVNVLRRAVSAQTTQSPSRRELTSKDCLGQFPAALVSSFVSFSAPFCGQHVSVSLRALTTEPSSWAQSRDLTT